MIARVAESCFWMTRYMERVESAARIMGVHRSFIMTAKLDPISRWRPMLIVMGEEPGFLERHGEAMMADGDVVQEDLTWSEACPVSIMTSLRWARENARTSRETISLEMWHSLNSFWLWMNSPEARELYDTQRHAFYQRVIQHSQHFVGVFYGTMLRHQPYDFMRLGFYLERAGQTARLIDVYEHLFAQDGSAENQPAGEEDIFWSALLRSCSGQDMFLKTSRRPRITGADVFTFLVCSPDFPRAILYGLRQADRFIHGFREHGGPRVGQRSSEQLTEMVARVREMAAQDTMSDAHEHLTWIVDHTAMLCDTIGEEFFNSRALPPAL